MDDDEATAMASVNPQMVVDVHMAAIVLPLFVEGAAPIGLVPGDNMPFSYVNWETMQSVVLSDTGAQFSVIPVEIGANQVPIPIGDGIVVSCGPFACAEGPMAPPLSIADSTVCSGWDPTVEIMVGKVDNDVIPPEEATDDATAYATGVDTNDGVDLGIVTSSSLEMNVKHVFSGVSGGENTSKTVKAAKGSNKTLEMAAVASIHVDGDFDVTGAGTEEAPYGVNEEAVCEDTADGEGRYDDGDITDKPEGCFRLRGPGAGRGDNDPGKGADYLSGWTIELSPIGGDVSWGRVAWEDDPFEDLECGAVDPIVVADHVDICEMFEDEVDNATGKGWKPTVVFRSETPGFTETTPPTGNQVVMWKADASPASGYTKMFKTIWFDDNLDGKILKDTKTRPMQRNADDSGNVAGDKFNDLYNHNSRDENIEQIWEFLTDDDDDLTSSDLGLVDLVSSTDDRDTADDERTIAVESCPDSNPFYAPKDGYSDETTRSSTTLDDTPCKTRAQRGTLDGVARTASATATEAHPDGNADNYEVDNFTTFAEVATTAANRGNNRTVMDNADDFYECTEDDGGDDPGEGSSDPNTICDAEWVRDATVTFADGTFGCSTTLDVTITCKWDSDGSMAQGRNALPSAFMASDKDFFLKCEAE
ncbi:MAG: hypothetical protein F4Z65_08990 [Acidobacteria bacterium]|nr:hypothetical protein [Acidobacteriota bacterium]